MATADPWRLTASELGAAYARGELSPVDCVQALLARIEALNPRLNAVIALNPRLCEQAAASAARWRAGAALGPLDGVPVAVKDNILVAGMPTTWGSRALADFVPAEDEFPVARLRAGGALIVGKTNCPEFTLEGYTHNELFGTTCNPWDTRLTPGGSSGGSVSGVAAGLFPLALGTDGGGSIRRPASHTGLVGLKPGIGAIARFPTLPQILFDFEVIGPVTRSVADAALVFEALAGPHPCDPLSLAVPREVRGEGAGGRALEVLYVPRFGDNPLDREIAASTDAAAQILRAIGYRVRVGELPLDLEPVTAFWPLMGQVGVAHLFELYPQAAKLAASRFCDMAEAGRGVGAARYLAGIEAVRRFRRQVAALFEEVDLIMTPSAAALPWPAAEGYPPRIDGREVGPRGHAVYTGWVNACGHPAINLPSAAAASGLPIGFQLVGARGADRLLLEVAARYEAARAEPWRWPPLN